MNERIRRRENGSRDPETLEREIRQTRAEMNDTLDSLERKLTAGQLLDQCLRFFGRSGRDIGASLGHTAKENPVPMLLTATGIAWMMFAPSRRSSTRYYRDYETDVLDDYGEDYGSERRTGAGIRERVSRVGEGLSERASGIGERLSEGASSMGQRVSEGVSSVGERLSERASNVSDRIRSGATATRSQLSQSKEAAKEAVSDTFNRAAYRAQTQYERAREGFSSILEEQPLVIGALGLAIGAAIGAALPATEREDQLMGEMRDKTIAKAKEAGAAAYEKGRETATQTAERVVQR